MVARGTLGAICERRGGAVGLEQDHGLVRAWRWARAAAVSSGDDGEVAGLRLLHGAGVVAEDRAGDV